MSTDAATGLDILEALDFDLSLSCEGLVPLGFDGFVCPFDAEADLLIEVHFSGNRYTVCLGCWAEVGDGRMEPCRYVFEPETRDEHYRIERVLR